MSGDRGAGSGAPLRLARQARGFSQQQLAGRVLAVLGPSGAGKTMLLETIVGLRPQQSGRILLAGTDLSTLPPERRRVGLVF